MPTNEERREVAARLRGGPYDTIIPYRTGIHFGMGCHEAANRFWDMCERIKSAGDYDIAYSTRYILADLIEPDYTNEEIGYFVLPKPKDPIICEYNSVDGSVYDIINENAREWQRQIEEDIQQRLFETFRKTCTNVGEQMTCSECGAHVYGGIYEHSFVDENGKRIYTSANKPKWNYCPNCGAKVVEK